MDDKQADAAGNGEHANQPQVAVQKIYVRDASIEVPDGPLVFTREFNPELNVELNTNVQHVDGDGYQITLVVTVTAKQDDKTAYIVEVQQAGVFQVVGFDDVAQHAHVLGAYCPGVLFPYVRETVSAMVQRAGFPPFLLQPVNFDSLYQQQQLQQQQQQQGAQATESATH